MLLNGLDFLHAIYACLYIGIIPILLPVPEQSRVNEDVKLLYEVLSEFSVEGILVNSQSEDLLKSKVFPALKKFDGNSNFQKPATINISKVSKGKTSLSSRDPIFFDWANEKDASLGTAIVQIYLSPDMKKKSVFLSHETIMEQCAVQVIHCQMLESTQPSFSGGSCDKFKMTPVKTSLLSSTQSWNGIGFLYSAVVNIYVGCLSIVLPPADFTVSPTSWLDLLYKHNGILHPLSLITNGSKGYVYD